MENSSMLLVTSSKWSPRIRLDVRSSVDLTRTFTADIGLMHAVDHISLDSLKSRRVRLGYTPSALTDAVADLAVMLVLMAQRRAGEVIN